MLTWTFWVSKLGHVLLGHYVGINRTWAVDALRSVGVDVLEDQPGVVPKGDAKWDSA